MDAFAVHTRETLEKELTEKIEELEEERDKKLEEKEENIKKTLEEAQQEENELRVTEEDPYNRIKLKIQQEIAHQLMQLEEDKIKTLWIAKQEKERIYQTETERYTEATKNYFEDLKKALAKKHKSELEELKKKYQVAYKIEEVKDDKANQRCWQEQLTLYHQKELSLQHLWPIPLQGGPPHKPTEDNFLTALGIRDTNPEAIRYIQEFKRWRERRKELNLPAIVNPLLEFYYQIYSSDEEAEITCRLCEENSSGRENIERLQAPEAKAKTPTEVEKDQNTTGTESDIDLQAIVALKRVIG